MKECRRVCVSTPWRASTSTMARSAVEAPVAMLRVYCSWPGVSATMKRRLFGGEEAVGDVDRDALLALGVEPVHQQREIDVLAVRAVLAAVALERRELVVEDQLGVVEQPPDQRRLAVIHAAAGEEAQEADLLLLGEIGFERLGRAHRRE